MSSRGTGPILLTRMLSNTGNLRRGALLALLLISFAGFVALGVWQIERRAWKLALIEQVDAYLAAGPAPAPGPDAWDAVDRDDEYRRLSVRGRFHHERETCTKAVTVRGPGCWVLTPLQTEAGWWLLVNRGFVDDAHRDPATRAPAQLAGIVAVRGLLRASEPGGGFLRRNDPAGGHWYSRDVAAIAQARGLPAAAVAPYFLDAEDGLPGGPVGGLTVVRFRNAHLSYALTWFGLAAMALLGIGLLFRFRAADRHSGEA